MREEAVAMTGVNGFGSKLASTTGKNRKLRRKQDIKMKRWKKFWTMFASIFRDRVGSGVRPDSVSVNSFTQQVSIGSESGLHMFTLSDKSTKRVSTKMSRIPTVSTSYLDAGVLIALSKHSDLHIFDTCAPGHCEEVAKFPSTLTDAPSCLDTCLSLSSAVFGTARGTVGVLDIRDPLHPSKVPVDGPVTCVKVLGTSAVVATTRGLSLWDLRLINAPLLRFRELKADQLDLYLRQTDRGSKRPRLTRHNEFIEDVVVRNICEKSFERSDQVNNIFPYTHNTIACHQPFPACLEIYSASSGRLLEQVPLPNTANCVADSATLARRFGPKHAVLLGHTDGGLSVYDIARRAPGYVQHQGAHVGGVVAVKTLGNWGSLTVGSDGVAVVQKWSE